MRLCRRRATRRAAACTAGARRPAAERYVGRAAGELPARFAVGADEDRTVGRIEREPLARWSDGRVVLLGDHNQLPPVVKNQAFQRFSHLDQSMFARFIRLGVPHVLLNMQGRARPSIGKIAIAPSQTSSTVGKLPRWA